MFKKHTKMVNIV